MFMLNFQIQFDYTNFYKVVVLKISMLRNHKQLQSFSNFQKLFNNNKKVFSSQIFQRIYT